MTDNLFTDQPVTTPQIDETKDYWQEYVGPGGKFHDQDETKAKQNLAKAKAHSDAYIEILERRLDERTQSEQKLRDEYNTTASLREILDQMKSQQKQTLDSSEQPPGDENTQPALKPEDIQSLVARQVEELARQRQEQANFEEVQAKLKERLGPNYTQVLREQTTSLGMTPEMVNTLARTAPKAFFRTMGLDETPNGETFQTPPKSSSSFTPKTVKRTWAWYQELKKNDPKTYNKRETAVQMMQDRQELGEEFKDGDWYAFQRR